MRKLSTIQNSNIQGNNKTTKAYWVYFRKDKNYIFRDIMGNFREKTRNFREITRNICELMLNIREKTRKIHDLTQNKRVHLRINMK